MSKSKDDPDVGRKQPICDRSRGRAVAGRETPYSAVVEQAGDAFFVHDSEGRIVDINPKACELLGYSRAELLTMTIQDTSAVYDPMHAKRLWDDVRAGSQSTFETRLRRKDDAVVPVEITLSALLLTDSTLILGIVRDLTQRIDQQQAYGGLMDSMNDAVVVVGPDNKFMQVNSRAAEVLGYSRHELLSMGPADIDVHLGTANIDQILDRVRSGQRCTEESVHRAKDGREFPVEIAMSPAPYMGVQTVLGVVRDVTVRKLIEESLLKVTERNQAILQTIPDIIAEVDEDKVYRWANNAALEFFGDDMIGKEASDYFVSQQDTYEAVAPLFSGEADSRYVESWQRRQDGQSRLLVWWCRTLKDAEGHVTGALSTARDVTELRRAEVHRDARLRLLELAPELSLEEFLQAALREMEILTSSSLGFCNLILDEGEAFTAGAWASLDDTETCGVDSGRLHHSISEAGIWADSARARRTIVYNDYQSQAGRKGTPTGHVELVRMLSVPMLRADKVVAVFVLGNKSTDYTDQDIESATDFADITWDTASHKRTEMALQESDALNRRLFDLSPDPVFLSEPGGRFLDCNHTAVETYGYSRAELLNMTYRDLAAPSVRESAGAHVPETLRRGGTRFEWLHQRKDGTELPVEIRTSAFIAQGQQRIMATVRDLSKYKDAQEAARRSEREFRALFEAAPVGIGVTDMSGNILAFNDAALKPGGYSREDVEKIGNVTALYYDARDRDRALALFLAEGSLSQYEVQFKRKDGTPYDASLSLTHTTFYGEPCIQAIFEDRTERKSAERALLHSEERFKSLSAMSSEGIMIHENGVVLDANQAFAELVGFSDAEELIGKLGFDVLPVSEQTRASVMKHAREKSEAALEIELLGPEGAPRWAETGGSEITYRDRPARLVFLRDITNAKLAQAEQDRLQDQLRQAAKMESIGRLAGGVAHDYNNMLAVILGHVDLALEQVSSDESLRADLEEIRKAASHSAAITQQLLAFARRQVATPQVIDPNETISGMLVMLRRLIGEQVKLAWLPGEDLGRIQIDPAQLDQVLVNLCLNARDAVSGSGNVNIVSSQVSLADEDCEQYEGCAPGDYLVLSVTDDGEGISPAALEHMFEPFFTTKQTGEGTGLGLSTVYGIVRQNDGFITVSSEPGSGTEVRIYLPKVDAPPTALPSPSPSDQRRTAGGDETLLLVEDEPSVLRLAARILEAFDYRVLTAHTPGEALRIAEQHPEEIALAITDIVMPEMKGWELSERLRKFRPNLRTLYVSGYTDDVPVDDGRGPDEIDFLPKPFTPQQLAEAVRTALDRE